LPWPEARAEKPFGAFVAAVRQKGKRNKPFQEIAPAGAADIGRPTTRAEDCGQGFHVA